jgi:predicted RNA binding protein YcfA (HicA-like mRNA interferase family)
MLARQKGSHVILKKQTSDRAIGVVVPVHDEIDRGTLLEIIRQAGMKKEDFLKLI